METRDLFKERGRANEAAYFHAQDAKLLEKLRARATLGELAAALAAKLRVDDPELLATIGRLGLTEETGPALLLAPLVQVAWAEGGVRPRERNTVLALAEARGLPPGSPAHEQLVAWLEERPPAGLFEVALKTIREGLSVLPPAEREERVRRYVDACKDVAMAAGGFPDLFGMGGAISEDEADLLAIIAAKLRERLASS